VPGTALAALTASGCNLDVADPGVVRPEQLADTASLPTLYGGALSDFAAAYAGNSNVGEEGIILAGGLRADEWLNRDTFTTREEIDRGAIQLDNASLVDVFRNMHRARVSAERAATRYAAAAPDDPRHALSSSLAGFTYVLLGENFCSGIPFSTYDETTGTFTFDAPLTTDQTFQRGLTRFDAALAAAQRSGDARAINVARIGRARALLDLGRFAEAGQAAAQVPLDFSFDIEFSTNTQRQQNAVFFFNNVDYRWGVADQEGGVGVPFVTAEDPRVPVRVGDPDAGEIGLDGEDQVPLVFQGKYGSRSAGIPLATGVEAALIRAEAALQAGNVATFLAEHNALRARVGLPALTASAATPRRTLEDVHFQERALWLFSTAHRLGDMRRLLRAPYARTFAEVFPTGEYFKGGVEYGTEANLPIPFDEQNNPRFTSCQNRTQ
jgi:hypothetical protein